MTTVEAGTSELSRAAGLTLDAYRRDHVGERIKRALEREGVSDIPSLAALIARDQEARTRFRRSVAVSVSGLFRDPAQFDLLEGTLLPRLIADRRRISVWSAGCADGSELYSVAVLLQRLGVLDRALLLGSDLLACRQRAGFEQDRIRDADLAQIVEEEAVLQLRIVEQVAVDRPCKLECEPRDPLGVATGLVVA